MHNRQGLSLKLLWDALMDYDLWPLYLISFTMLIPTNPESAYLTLFLKSLGFDTFQVNLLTIPGYVLFLIQLVFWTWVSEKINNRMAIVLFYSFWCLPLLIALVLLPSSASPWAWYGITVLIIGYPYIHSINGTICLIISAIFEANHAITVSLISRNAGSVRTRTVGSAVYNMICQAGSIIASNVGHIILPRSLLSCSIAY